MIAAFTVRRPVAGDVRDVLPAHEPSVGQPDACRDDLRRRDPQTAFFEPPGYPHGRAQFGEVLFIGPAPARGRAVMPVAGTRKDDGTCSLDMWVFSELPLSRSTRGRIILGPGECGSGL